MAPDLKELSKDDESAWVDAEPLPKPDVPYSEDPAWSDVIPLAQDDGGPNALATIAYTDEYREATSYLRALMAENEFSERGLLLTEHIIHLNPAHYTVWSVVEPGPLDMSIILTQRSAIGSSAQRS